MENKKIRMFAFKNIFKLYYIILGCLILAFAIEVLSLLIAYAATKNNDLLIAFGIISAILIAVICLFALVLFNKSNDIYYKELMGKTTLNYEKILDQNINFSDYSENEKYVEFDHLNNLLHDIEKHYQQAVLLNGELNYKDLPFEFINNDINLISYKSFIKHHKELLYRTQYYRNAFVSFVFPVGKTGITSKERYHFYDVCKKIFNYSNILLVDNSEKNEFILFIPNFDSMNQIKEDVENSLKDLTIIRHGPNGQDLLTCSASMVVYPYSNMEDIISDLRYANRQGKLLNFYFPNKEQIINSNLLQQSLNTNAISRILEKYISVDYSNYDIEKLTASINKMIDTISKYLNFENAGVFVSNPLEDNFHCTYSIETKEEFFLFKDKKIDKSFITELEKNVDEDNTFYFSNRNHVSPSLGKFLDRYGIVSGHFYLHREENKTLFVLYFVKYQPLFLDSYLRESLLIFSYLITTLISRLYDKKDNERREKQLNDILKISGFNLYSIEDGTYKLLSISPILKEMFPHAEIGMKCHKVLYDKENPCAKCPLVTGKKMYDYIKDKQFESSLVLNTKKSYEKQILLIPYFGKEIVARERFDRDLLANTYFSYLEDIKDSFSTSQRGYSLIFSIDNNDELIKFYNNEEYNAVMRSFLDEIRKMKNYISEIYFLPNKSFALILPDATKKEVIFICERVFEISKKMASHKEGAPTFYLSYYAQTYPYGYQNPEEFVRFFRSECVTPFEHLNNDMIFMPEIKYIRSANHKAFILDVLENSINKNTFSVKLQPVVNKNDRNISSAELLLRVSDSFMGSEMNTFEIIQEATKNNKISLITDVLIDYIGTLYKQYENKLFKKYGVNTLSLNTDFSFFQGSNFVEKVQEMRDKYNLPDDFLTFEIQEAEISNKFDSFVPIVKSVAANNIKLVCDNYTGRYLSLNKIRDLGFYGVKVDRAMVSKVDNDKAMLNGVKDIIDNAIKLDLKVTLVGVENKEQYGLLKEDKNNFGFQGYYFYKPLDAEELINSLIKLKGIR